MFLDRSLLTGLRWLFRGLRTGNSNLALVGVLVFAFGVARRRRGGRLLYETKLKPGQTVRIERPARGEALEIKG